MEVVAEAGDADDAIRKVRAHRPTSRSSTSRCRRPNTDDGLRAAIAMRAELPDTGVLVLSQFLEESYALELIADDAEGVGYLLKDRVMDIDGFVESIRRWPRAAPCSTPRSWRGWSAAAGATIRSPT